MAARKIKNQPASLAYSPIAIYYDSEYGEYQVRIKGRPNDTYYTDDKNDAISTAQHMRNNALLEPVKSNPSRRPSQSAIFKKANQLMREGYERKQAFAVAYSELGEPKRAKKNPAPKRKTAARTQRAAVGYVNRPSQITKAAPSKRLKKRRTINLQVPRGVFPNPSPRYVYYVFAFPDGWQAINLMREESPEQYGKDNGAKFAIGPFRTKRGAEYMAKYGQGNPHLRSVNDAERLAKIKTNPDSVHFDIDVNSHNARGAKAKTSVNPIKKEIVVQQSLDRKHWTTFARFPDTAKGKADALEYATAYAKKEPYLYIQVTK